MPKISIGFLCVMLLLMSCKKKNTEQESEYSLQLDAVNTIKAEQVIVQLNEKSKELVKAWPEYQKFSDLVSQYQEITLSDALLNSKELSELAKQLRDSIRIESLNIHPVKMRLNVLYSETLRLADMATIPTITEPAVSQENNNIIQAFSALNLKINNINSMEKLNSEISAFVEEVMEEKDSVPPIKKDAPNASKDSL
jgi:hypothetical protein